MRWQQDAIVRIDAMAALAENWDRAGAEPIALSCRERAKGLLETLPVTTPAGSVAPSPSGGVTLEWQHSGRWLFIEFEQDGDIAAAGETVDSYQTLAVDASTIDQWLTTAPE